MAALRLVTEPPDAPLDPVKELIDTKAAVLRLAANPLFSNHADHAVEAFADLLDRFIPNSNPKRT